MRKERKETDRQQRQLNNKRKDAPVEYDLETVGWSSERQLTRQAASLDSYRPGSHFCLSLPSTLAYKP